MFKMTPTYDFCGWATKNDLECSDGRTIRRDAFKDDDGKTVPLVWNHMHDAPDNILGHAMLENRPEGMYTYGNFNDTEKGQLAKALLEHGDITALSILANKLLQNGKNVMHGAIREVSLVLAPANPGAFIDTVLAHGDQSDKAAIIYTGELLEIAHGDCGEPKTKKKEKEIKDSAEGDDGQSAEEVDNGEEERDIREIFDTLTEKQKTTVYTMIGQMLKGDSGDETNNTGSAAHAEDAESGETLEDIFKSLNEEQKTAVYKMLVAAMESKAADTAVESGEAKDTENNKGEKTMKHNVFDESTDKENTLSHSDIEVIFNDAKRGGSLRDAVIEHGITNIDYLFPDAKNVNPTPDFIKRDDSWVTSFMNSVHRTPFSRIKSIHANLTEEDARAKGYIKGRQKADEVFSLLKRSTTPTTVYKKQKLERDDVVDITDFDVVGFVKSEMRVMLDEEIARASLTGDGRLASSDDKINEQNIRPIWTDADLYTIKVPVPTQAADTDDDKAKAFIKATLKARKNYKGSGKPTLYTTEDMLTIMLLLTDSTGRDIYENEEKLATKLRVKEIITVPVMEGRTRTAESTTYTLAGIIVNPVDYNIGADKGGAVNMFDDFDINYNAMRYLIETRCSGALTKPYSAMAIEFTSAVTGG